MVLWLAWGESGHRRRERGFVLIVRPYPLTDTSQRAALWESAPAEEEEEELTGSSCRTERGKAGGKK